MKLGSIKFRKQNAYAFYMTADFEGFESKIDAKHHIKFLDDKTIYYVIQDENGNTLKKVIV